MASDSVGGDGSDGVGLEVIIQALRPIAKGDGPSPDAQRANVTKFPLRKKAGAKVRKGPAAEIVPLRAERSGRELLMQWQWLFMACTEWTTDDLEAPATALDELENFARNHRHFNEPMPPEYREMMLDQVHCFQEMVERRTRLKKWIAEQGATDRDLRSAQMALEFLYKRARG